MTPPEDPLEDRAHLDQQLREALSPSPEQAERIIRRALAIEGSRAPRLRHLLPAASFLALLTAAAAFFALHPVRPRQEAVVSITNVDGMVIATSQEEERPLILSGAGEDQPSGIIIVRHGEPE